MTIEAAAWDDSDVRRITTGQQTEIRARYGGKGEPGRPPSARCAIWGTAWPR